MFSSARSVLISNGEGAGNGGVVDMFAGRRGWRRGKKKVLGGIPVDRHARCQGFFQSYSKCLALLFLHFFFFLTGST